MVCPTLMTMYTTRLSTGTVIIQLLLLQQGDLLLWIQVMMQGKRVRWVNLIILSHLWLSCAIKHIDNRFGPFRKSSMGPITSDHHGPSGEPHPGGREPHQSHRNIGWITNQNCTTTGCQSLDWLHHRGGHDSSINPWRGLNMVHGPFLSKKGF